MQVKDMRNLNLQDYTRHKVRQYLQDLEGHQAHNLYDFVVNEIEIGIILEVMEFTCGNQSQASEILGITRTTLRNKIRKHNLLK